MNVYDRAHDLARALKDCDEVREFRQINKKIGENENSKKMLEDLRNIQLEAYKEQMETGDISDETKDKMEKLGSVISLNPDIAQYMQSEAKLGTMWEDIMKILQEALDLE